ncbi:MAG: phosphatase PAP2 family protein [Lachnospiraceae bacterium]|nr:phosphatase PAP2 family protein [Lachnospiraceae bacterium]
MRARWEKGYITRLERLIPAFIYLFIYMRWFNLLEDARPARYAVMHTALDDRIPFVEIFVVPYYIWFFYVILTLAFLLFLRHSEDYYKALIFMCFGMTVFLVFSTIVPTMQPLRPAVMPRDNAFTRLIAHLYRTDTPTNVFPSIHVYNSIACMIALCRAKVLDGHKMIRAGACVLSVSIILSTMFIKQHSVIDVAGAFVLAFIAYRIVYQSELVNNMFHVREREFSLPARWSLF